MLSDFFVWEKSEFEVKGQKSAYFHVFKEHAIEYWYKIVIFHEENMV